MSLMTLQLGFVLLLLATPCVVSGAEYGGHCCSGGSYDTNNCFHWCISDETKPSNVCEAEYVPGGTKIILEPIEAPVATLKDYSNAQEAVNAGFFYELTDGVIDMAPQKVTKHAMQFAKGLGIFGAVLGGVGNLFKPTPNDILDAVNKAIKELTDEINAQFTNMEAYVDQSIMEAQQTASEDFLLYFANLFANCIEEKVESKFMDCLDQSERSIHASSSKFMRYQSYFADKDNVFVPSLEDVKRMEMEFLTFMNYATLRTVNLLIMYDTYNNQTGSEADLQVCRFLESLETELSGFLGYTNNVYKAILEGHNTKQDYNYFLENFERKWEHAEEHSYYDYTESWHNFLMSPMLPDSETYQCVFNQKVRHDKNCKDCDYRIHKDDCKKDASAYEMSRCRSRDRAFAVYKDYTNNMVKSAENYWKPQTIDRMKPWQAIVDQVPGKLAAKGCETSKSAVKSGKVEL